MVWDFGDNELFIFYQPYIVCIIIAYLESFQKLVSFHLSLLEVDDPGFAVVEPFPNFAFLVFLGEKRDGLPPGHFKFFIQTHCRRLAPRFLDGGRSFSRVKNMADSEKSIQRVDYNTQQFSG